MKHCAIDKPNAGDYPQGTSTTVHDVTQWQLWAADLM